MNSDKDPNFTVDLHSASPSNLFKLPSFCKRKKGKPNFKKQQAIERKIQSLLDKIRPIPFSPSKILYFAKHEKLLVKLGLWDFVHIEFDKTVRTDLIAQLVATYDSKARYSYVNGVRIRVNRTDLGRAFKLPVIKLPLKKEKVSGVGEGVEVELDSLSEEEIGFIEDFVSNWLLLHEDTWMMPGEVLNWIKVIRDGHLEKVDWAGLFWFMVEKELTKGEQLVDCYYASHLQYLIKCQREEVVSACEPYKVDLEGEEKEVVLAGEPDKVDLNEKEIDVAGESGKVDFNGEEKEVVVGVSNENYLQEDTTNEVEKEDFDVGVVSRRVDLNEEENEGGLAEGSLEVYPISDVQKEDADVPKRPNIELTLGDDTRSEEEIVEEEEKVHDPEMMDLEEENEHADDDNPGKWQLDTENTVSEHTLQRCNMGVGNELYNYGGVKEEVEDIEEEGEEEAEDTFDILENHDTLLGDGLTGNFLQAMQETKLEFSSHEQLHSQPDIGLIASRNVMQHTDSAGPSFYGNGSKRAIEHMSENTQNCNSKRLRIDGPWNNESPNFGMCMDGMQQFITRATMLYEAKEQSLEQSNMNQQILLNEVQKRDNVIEHLHKSQCEVNQVMQKKDEEIYRLERELHVMGNLLDGYRGALKVTQKAFAEYKQLFPQPEESIYKDAGPGGLMLTTEEIERRRRKQQEDYRSNCLMLEHKAKEAEDGYACQFTAFIGKVHELDGRLVGLENEMMELKKRSGCCGGTETEQLISSKTSMPGVETGELISSKTSMPGNDEGTECTEAEQLISINTSRPGDDEGMEKGQPVSKETSMLEQPSSGEIDTTDNCEGMENEELIPREASVPEQPDSSNADVPDIAEGTENEGSVSSDISMPDNDQGTETEQN
ncbi:hypothetical protein Leryth_008471 [Lithospermum erythrorhizon]|nr:hypothetical protein Leryth_008471 [Lithospermum erythrorhizon]